MHASRMTERTPRIGVLAPMRTEFKPLVKPLGLEPIDDTYHRGAIGGVEIIATQTGIGTQSATDVTERLLDDHELDHVIVVGHRRWTRTGARRRRPRVPRGRRRPSERHDAPGDTHRRDRAGRRHRDVRRVQLPREILDGFITDGVLAVDMETGSVAGVCERRGVPWTAFRSLSDHDQKAPVDTAVLGLATPEGGANVKAVLRYVGPKPWRLKKLSRLARDSQTATRAAAGAAVAACERHDWSSATS